MRTMLTFRSDRFNTTEERDHFINPGNYGDDLARWLIERLAERGRAVEDEPGQEDFGWYVTFEADGVRHWLLLGYRPPEPGEPSGDWIAWVERSRGCLGLLLGRRGKRPREGAVRLVHELLAAAPEVGDVRWHVDAEFRCGREDRWQAAPFP